MLDQVISAQAGPGFAPPGSRWLPGSRSDGDYRRTGGRSLSPAGPIPAEEGSNQCAVNTRASAPVGRGLAAGDLGSRWLRLRPKLPTMV